MNRVVCVTAPSNRLCDAGTQDVQMEREKRGGKNVVLVRRWRDREMILAYITHQL